MLRVHLTTDPMVAIMVARVHCHCFPAWHGEGKEEWQDFLVNQPSIFPAHPRAAMAFIRPGKVEPALYWSAHLLKMGITVVNICMFKNLDRLSEYWEPNSRLTPGYPVEPQVIEAFR